MATKDSLLTYQDADLAGIAAIYGDRLEKLELQEKFAVLGEISKWGEHCAGLPESDWSSLGEFFSEHGEVYEDWDAFALLKHADIDWVDPKFAMPFVIAIAHQIAEEIYLPGEAE